MVDDKEPVPIKVGDVVNKKYEVKKQLGQGAFGAVFEVVDKNTNESYALKMELEVPGPDEPGLDLEVGVLKRMQHSHHAVRYIDSGKIATLNFIVMELVGCNLSDLRKACPDHRFTLCTSLRLGLQCLDAIEAMHASGLLHRDIKPANYALGRTVKDYRTVYILDFGLVRRWRLKNGKVRPPRNVCGFRGTAKYASINCHLGRDWGRVDDLWSWLYMLVEFQTGSLPWRMESKRSKIRDLKIEHKISLFKSLEPENLRISYSLNTLEYADEPPYHWYRQQLGQITQRKSVQSDDPYDWEPKGPYHEQLKKVCPQPFEKQMKSTRKVIKERTSGEESTIELVY